MNNYDRAARDGAIAALEIATLRGLPALERAWDRFTPRQRALVTEDFIQILRHECTTRAGHDAGDQL